MIISIYPNERQLVNAFMEYTFSHPIPLTNGETRKLFIWGNEIWLPDGKSRNRSGILDVIGTDEKGNVWLIEAKLCSNPELNGNIWREQLDPYRLSLSKRSEDEIVMGARRYLIKANADSVFPPFINDSVEGLYDGFKHGIGACHRPRIIKICRKALRREISAGLFFFGLNACHASKFVKQARITSISPFCLGIILLSVIIME